MHKRNDWRYKRNLLCKHYNKESYRALEEFLVRLYEEGLSTVEIEEMIFRDIGETYTARSLQRLMRKYGVNRSQKESFRNAMRRGRVVWQLEEDAIRRETNKQQISRVKRYKIMQRDGNKCVLCGARELLQIDHIIARVNGGGNGDENLRTLCIDCNLGKRMAEGEFAKGTGWKSGMS